MTATELSGTAHDTGTGATGTRRRERGVSTRSEFKTNKLEWLERHKPEFRAAIVDGIARRSATHVAFILDDFYLIPRDFQPELVGYVYSLVRGTKLYLKIGTIRHRSRLSRVVDGHTTGIEKGQDFESIDLDQTFENVAATRDSLKKMFDSMGEKVGIQGAADSYLSLDGQQALALASGGVPRDYLNIFVEAVEDARNSGVVIHVTPKNVYRGAAREAYRTKQSNFREDAGTDYRPLEHLYNDLSRFCLDEKRKTAFLISQTEAQSDPEGHELIRQLMDLKLVHVIEPDTSAASGRPGRFEAYTLDFAKFMEPRRRNIELVEFWKRDANSRPSGVREAPVYSLARGRAAAEQTQDSVGVPPDEASDDFNEGER